MFAAGVEVLHVVTREHLGLGLIGVLALFLVTGPATALCAGLLALLVRGFWRGTIAGLLAFAAARLVVAFTVDPAPFAEGFPGQGEPMALAAALVGLCILAIAVGSLPPRGRVGAVAAVFALAAFWVAPELPGARAPAVHAGPNVLLVTLDTARADRFEPGARVGTPGFEEVARTGVRFSKAISPIPATGPAHVSLLTGKPPWEHGVLRNGGPVPPDLPLLAERLRFHRYRTAAFVSAYVLDGNLGFERGFDAYDDAFTTVKGVDRVWPGAMIAAWWRHRDPDAILERRADDTVDAAIRWIGSEEGAWFAWVHLFDAHGPYAPPPPWDHRYDPGVDPRDPSNRSLEAAVDIPAYQRLDGVTDREWVESRYDAEISYADSALRRLLHVLDARGAADDTLVVVVGDHGEGLGEDGEWYHHGSSLHPHALRVPLAVRWPGHVPAGRVVDTPISTAAVHDTVLDLVGLGGVQSAVRAAWEGREVPVPMALAWDRRANTHARAHDPGAADRNRMAAAVGTQHVVVHETGEIWPPDADPELVARARDLLRGEAPETQPSAPSDQEALRRLGYLDGP